MAGCVPLNLFGDGTVSQAALNYIAPGRLDKSIEDQALYIINQSVFSASAQGTLPWGLPAGKIAVALGAEDRLEQQRVRRDPLQLGASGVFESGNFAQYAGQYNVQEAFGEITVPILKDDFVQSLEFNAAGRYTNYSTSGPVQTWKLGATSQVNEGLQAAHHPVVRYPRAGHRGSFSRIRSSARSSSNIRRAVPAITSITARRAIWTWCPNRPSRFPAVWWSRRIGSKTFPCRSTGIRSPCTMGYSPHPRARSSTSAPITMWRISVPWSSSVTAIRATATPRSHRRSMAMASHPVWRAPSGHSAPTAKARSTSTFSRR